MTAASSALTAFAEAVRSTEFETAADAFSEYETILDRQKSTEESRIGRVLAARNQGASVDLVNDFTGFATTHMGIELQRISILTDGSGSLTDPYVYDLDEFASRVDALADAERDYENRKQDIEDELESFDLGPVLVIEEVEFSSIVPKGEETLLRVRVKNVGDREAEDVSIAIDTSLPLDPDSVSRSIVDPGDTLTFESVGKMDAADDCGIVITISLNGNRIDQRNTEVAVLDKMEFAGIADASLDDLRERIGELDVSEAGRTALDTPIRQAQRSVERAKKYVEEGKSTEANNMLTRATNQIGAFLNALAGTRNGRADLDETVVWSLERLAEAVIDQLTQSRSATI